MTSEMQTSGPANKSVGGSLHISTVSIYHSLRWRQPLQRRNRTEKFQPSIEQVSTCLGTCRS